jgi:hypothetical protein
MSEKKLASTARPILTALELHDGWIESLKNEKYGMI